MRKTVSVILILVMICSTFCISFGAFNVNVKAETLQDQIDSKQDKIDSLQKKLDSLEKEGKEMMAKLSLLNEQTEEIESQIDLTEDRISELEDDIEENEELIGDAMSDINERNDEMAARVRAIYMGGNSSYISMLFESKDFSSFLDNLDVLKTLLSADKKLVDEYTETKTGLEDIKEKLEADMSSLEKTKSDLVSQRKKLESNSSKIEKLLEEYEKAQEAAQKEMDRQYKQMQELIRLQSQGEFVGGEFMWPVAGFKTISAKFGQKGKYWKNGHTGIDICGYNSSGESIKGKPILASNSGTVIDINTSNTTTGYGNYVVISHGGGISTLYAHMMSKSATVKKGDTVVKGQVIGYVGTTGNSTGYHLHIEFIVDGERKNPLNYIRY